MVFGSIWGQHGSQERPQEAPKNEELVRDYDLHVFFEVLKVDENQNCASTEGGKHAFENRKINMHVDCDELKIRENRNCARHRGREALF